MSRCMTHSYVRVQHESQVLNIRRPNEEHIRSFIQSNLLRAALRNSCAMVAAFKCHNAIVSNHPLSTIDRFWPRFSGHLLERINEWKTSLQLVALRVAHETSSAVIATKACRAVVRSMAFRIMRFTCISLCDSHLVSSCTALF